MNENPTPDHPLEPSPHGLFGAPYRSVALTAAPAPERQRLALRARELGALALLMITIDIALWAHGELGSGGLGLALIFAGIPGLLLMGARARALSWRLGAIGALLGIVALRTAIAPTPTTTALGFVLVVGFALALRGRSAFVPESLRAAWGTVLQWPHRFLSMLAGLRRATSRSRLDRIASLPIAVPLLLCAAFLAVFALANPLVAHWLGVALDTVLGLGLPAIGEVITGVLALAIGVALIRPARLLAKRTEQAVPGAGATSTSLLVARNALVALNLLFLAYQAIDATYLWSGHPPAGMTTQIYAHQGALWLTVALAMLTGVVGVMFRGALMHDPRARLARGLAYAWVGSGLVLALGTYRRIAIHVGHSGLSNLRIVGILGTTLVVIGLVAVAIKLHRERNFRWLLRRQLDAFAVTLVLYAVAPTHWISAQVNVARIEAGERAPIIHMFAQSQQAESAPVLLPLLSHPDPVIRDGIAALLLSERGELERTQAWQAHSWQRHDLLTNRAATALLRARLPEPRANAIHALMVAGQAAAQ